QFPWDVSPSPSRALTRASIESSLNRLVSLHLAIQRGNPSSSLDHWQLFLATQSSTGRVRVISHSRLLLELRIPSLRYRASSGRLPCAHRCMPAPPISDNIRARPVISAARL